MNTAFIPQLVALENTMTRDQIRSRSREQYENSGMVRARDLNRMLTATYRSRTDRAFAGDVQALDEIRTAEKFAEIVAGDLGLTSAGLLAAGRRTRSYVARADAAGRPPSGKAWEDAVARLVAAARWQAAVSGLVRPAAPGAGR